MEKPFAKPAAAALALAALLTLGACTSSRPGAAPSLNPVYVTNAKKITLLSPENMVGSVESLMLFTGSFGDQQFSTPVYVQADELSLVLLLVNDFGVSMGSLNYDGMSAELDAPLFPPSLKAEYIIADFQNAYYDVAALESNYEASHLTFEQELRDDGSEVRRVLSGSTVVETIIRTDGRLVIDNHLRGYTYTLVEADE